MNTADIADHVAKAHPKLNKAQARKALDLAFSLIGQAAAKGEVVSLPGFGKFTVRDRAARTGKNPKTGEPIQIAASKALTFQPAKAVKDSLSK